VVRRGGLEGEFGGKSSGDRSRNRILDWKGKRCLGAALHEGGREEGGQVIEQFDEIRPLASGRRS